MTTLDIGICVLWPDTVASKPSGWNRKTELDGKYLRQAAAGANSDLVSALGASTHSHTSPAHNHTQNSHVHAFSAGARTGTTNTEQEGDTNSAINTHTHKNTNSDSTTATNQTTAMTVNTTSNDLLRFEPIILESDGTPTGIPANAIAFFVSDSFPSNWTRTQGNSYIKGAAGGSDGSAVQTGAVTHTHTSDAHNHTQDSHSHADTPSSNTGATETYTYDTIGVNVASRLHTHFIGFATATATNQNATATIDAANHEPPYRKINMISNGTGGDSLPDKVVCVWDGTNVGIPTNWARLTNFDGSFIKGANSDGESDVTTGGNTTHSHTSPNHTHVQDAHTHTPTDYGPDTNEVPSGAATMSSYTHTHTWTVANTTATNQNTAATVNSNSSESAYPAYQKIILIQYTAPVSGRISRLMMQGMG